jgi:hypothetical protein
MHATRLRGAGKPKVVTIRPISLSTTLTSVINELRSPDRLSTPTRPLHEISVFSPDTPVKDTQRALTWSTSSLRPLALTPQRYRRRNLAMPERTSSRISQSLRYSLETSPTEPQDTFAIDLSNYTITSPMRTPPPVLSSTSEAAAWARCRKLDSTLEAISQAMDTFPDGMLRLDSPAILVLRTPHSLDETHINALQRIFPQTASLLLSALAALLIVDSYFSSLGETCTSFTNLPQLRSKRKDGKLAARSNECLHDIPTKARATLGIHLPNVTSLQDHEWALRRRADMVAVCVGVCGQRLLEAICGKFDEVIWRALKVLVETLESDRS